MFSIITVNLIQVNPTDKDQQQILLILKILYASSVLIVTAIVLVILFAKHFIRDLDHLLLHECVPRDTTILNLEKIVSIGPDSETNGCKIIETREIRNNMPHDYNRYLFSRKMSHVPPTFDKYKFFVDDEKVPRTYSTKELNFEVEESTSCDPDVLRYKVEFKFPIQAKPHENKKLRFENPTHSFSDALKGKIDWTEQDVNSITEKMKMEVELVDGFENDFYIDYPSPPKDNDGARYDIEIRDYSRQRMWNSEENLKNEKIMPVFSGILCPNSRMTWVIYHPKIGYKYRMYFTIKQRNDTRQAIQTTLPEGTITTLE